MPVYSFYPKKRRNILDNFSITTIFIVVNVIVFIVISIFYALELISIDYFAIKPSNIVNGKYLWTFITSMFMHGGVFHLFANMFSLFFVGNLVEKILGRKRYFWFYILAGLFAGLFFVILSLLVFPSEFEQYAVGASGALFGVVGLLMILTPNLPVFVMLIPIPIKMKYAAPGLLIVLWLISVAAEIPVGNTAHLGGLIAGLGYGFYLKKKFPKKTKRISKMFS